MQQYVLPFFFLLRNSFHFFPFFLPPPSSFSTPSSPSTLPHITSSNTRWQNSNCCWFSTKPPRERRRPRITLTHFSGEKEGRRKGERKRGEEEERGRGEREGGERKRREGKIIYVHLAEECEGIVWTTVIKVMYNYTIKHAVLSAKTYTYVP